MANSPSPSIPIVLPPRLSPFLGFCVDVLIAVGVLILLSLGIFALWGSYRGLAVAHEMRQQALPVMPAAVAARVGQPSVLVQLLSTLFSTATPALVLYFWRRRASAAERQVSWAAIRCQRTWGWIALIAVFVFFFSHLASALGSFWGIESAPSNLPLIRRALEQSPLLLSLFAVLIAPAYEELLFRRVLFGRLLAAGRPWWGIVLSSAAFALLHEIPGLSGNRTLAIVYLWLVYGGMGAAFAWLYWRTGTLWAPFTAHAINNATALAALYFFGVP